MATKGKKPIVVTVKSWAELPEEVTKGVSLSELPYAFCDYNKNTIYIKEGTPQHVIEHEKYHLLHERHARLISPRQFIDNELSADLYAYQKTGQPKHILGRLRGISSDVVDVTKDSSAPMTPRDTARLIIQEFKKKDVPDTWKADFTKWKEELAEKHIIKPKNRKDWWGDSSYQNKAKVKTHTRQTNHLTSLLPPQFDGDV